MSLREEISLTKCGVSFWSWKKWRRKSHQKLRKRSKENHQQRRKVQFELHTQQHLPSHSQKVMKKLDMYNAEPPPTLNSDTLAWWSGHKACTNNVFICGYHHQSAYSAWQERWLLTSVIGSLLSMLNSWYFFLKITIKLSKAVHAWTSPVCFYACRITQIYFILVTTAM